MFPNFNRSNTYAWSSENGKSSCEIEGVHYTDPNFFLVAMLPNEHIHIGGFFCNTPLSTSSTKIEYETKNIGQIKTLAITADRHTMVIKKVDIMTEEAFNAFFATYNDDLLEVVIVIPRKTEADILRFRFSSLERDQWINKLNYLLIPFRITVKDILENNKEGGTHGK